MCSSSGSQILLYSIWYRHRTGWERTSHVSTCAPDGHLRVWWYMILCNAILNSWWWAQQCSKHVEAYNKLLRSSSGGQNCIIQHLVSSHSVGGCLVHRLRKDCAPDGHLQVLWYQMLYNTILAAWWCAHGARNMYRHIINLIIKQEFVH